MREALARLAALAATAALPRSAWASVAPDPLEGTIADYAAGLRTGRWSAAEVTARALERCRTDGMTWRAIDALSATAIAEAKAADARRRGRIMRGPLDGVPVFAKAIYDMDGLPTTASNAEWARLFPEPVRRDAIEVTRHARRRRGRARQDRGGRFRLPRRGHEQPHRTGAQPVRSHRHSHARRVQRRVGGRGRRRHGVRRARNGRWRIQPDSGRVHWHRRHEADVRPRAAHRRHPDVAVSRHPRSARAFGGGRGAAARRDCRRRFLGSARRRPRAGREAARGAARRCVERRAAGTRRGARAAREDDQ